MSTIEKPLQKFVALDGNGLEYVVSVYQQYERMESIYGGFSLIETFKELRCDEGRVMYLEKGRYRLFRDRWKGGQLPEVDLFCDSPDAP